MDSQFHGAFTNGYRNYADDPMPGEMLLRENVRLNGQVPARGLLNSAAVDDNSDGEYVFSGNPIVEVLRSDGEPTVQVPRDRRGVTARNSGPSVETPTDRARGTGEPVPTRLATGAPPPPLGADYFARYFGPNGSGYQLFGMNANRPSPALDYGPPGVVHYAGASARYGGGGRASGEAGAEVDMTNASGFAAAEAAGDAETARLKAAGIDPSSATGARVAQASAGGKFALSPEFIAGLGTAGARAGAQGATKYQLSGAQFSERSRLAMQDAQQANGGEPNNMRGLPDQRGYTGEDIDNAVYDPSVRSLTSAEIAAMRAAAPQNTYAALNQNAPVFLRNTRRYKG